MKNTLLAFSKKFIVAVLCMMNFASIEAQNQVYWTEGFELGSTPPCTFTNSSANAIIPGTGIGHFVSTTGIWYVAGAYRTTGTGCPTGVNHIRFTNGINDANLASTGVDTAYVVTPTVNFGIKELHFYRARANRGISVYATNDTAATGPWTLITSVPAYTATATCVDTIFLINSATAKRLKIVSKRSSVGLDNDIDSLSLTSFSAIIPVEMVSFTGKKQGRTNELTWVTATELNNKGYQVERGNGTEEGWDVIGFVKGNGKASTYHFMDKNPLTASGASSYYRLRQIDYDGKENVSKVISISNDATPTKLKIYPSVTTGYLTLEADTKESYQVLNLVGQVILQGNATLQRIDVTSLPNGTYMLKVGNEQAKFIKQ